MSHPIPAHTYEDDLLDQWTEEELSRLFEMYQEECRQSGAKATMSDFLIFLEERY